MITSGCSISLSNECKRLQEKIALVWRVDGDAFGGNQWPKFQIRQLYKRMQTVSPVRHVWSSFKFSHTS